jgi:hypothetical protein
MSTSVSWENSFEVCEHGNTPETPELKNVNAN